MNSNRVYLSFEDKGVCKKKNKASGEKKTIASVSTGKMEKVQERKKKKSGKHNSDDFG